MEKGRGMIWSLVLAQRQWNEGSCPGCAAHLLLYCSVQLSEFLWRDYDSSLVCRNMTGRNLSLPLENCDILQKSKYLFKWLMLPAVTRSSVVCIMWYRPGCTITLGVGIRLNKKKKRQNRRDYENIQLGFDSQNEAAVSAMLSELYFVPFLMA